VTATTPHNNKTVTIFGSSQPRQGEPLYQSAYELAAALGKAGFTICNGGYGGTMEATSRGAKDAGSTSIAVTCKLFTRSGPNAFVDQVIETEDLFSRLETLIELGRAYIVLPGGSGTLVELALVWELTAKGLLTARPIILYSDYWRPVVETTARERPHSTRCLSFANSSPQVLDMLADL